MTLRLPLVLMLVLGSLWGLSFSLAKLAITGGIHPLSYAWWQATGAALVLGLFCWRSRTPVPTGRRYLLFFAISGSTGLALPNITIVTTAAHLPAGILSTLVTTVPLITFALAVGFGIERFGWFRCLGLVLGLAGVLLIVGPETGLPDPAMVPWVLLALLTPTLYAIQNIVSVKLRPDDTPALAAAFGMVVMASALTLPIMLATGTFHPLFLEGTMVTNLAMLGQTCISALAYILYFEIVHRAGAVYVSQVGYVVNVFGVGWGHLIFGEVLSPWIWAAIGCVFAGVFLVNRQQSKV